MAKWPNHFISGKQSQKGQMATWFQVCFVKKFLCTFAQP